MQFRTPMRARGEVRFVLGKNIQPQLVVLEFKSRAPHKGSRNVRQAKLYPRRLRILLELQDTLSQLAMHSCARIKVATAAAIISELISTFIVSHS
jgi:hypothetical protein